MGCDGCELWNKTTKLCYAGKTTEPKSGLPGWPKSFDEPMIFPDRLPPALKWKDLTGTDRLEKPWLNGLPRIIFLNDMGDTFSKKLPEDWFAEFLPAIASSAHRFLVLTKRPSLFARFAARNPLPENVWLGTSVTSDATLKRVEQLAEIETGGPKFVSAEPLLDCPVWDRSEALKRGDVKWMIFGGVSGADAPFCDPGWIQYGVNFCSDFGIKTFVKQLGSNCGLKLKDSHGGDWNEWPTEFRVREMPAVKYQSLLI